MANIGEIQRSGDFTVQPSEEKVKQNSDNWPLLLKGRGIMLPIEVIQTTIAQEKYQNLNHVFRLG